jgi:hypothetical protein
MDSINNRLQGTSWNYWFWAQNGSRWGTLPLLPNEA